jgi:hypothetical protein
MCVDLVSPMVRAAAGDEKMKEVAGPMVMYDYKL